MADEDRQPPQSYDTVAPAGVGTASSNVKCPQGPWQEMYLSGDQGLLDVKPLIKCDRISSIDLWNPSPLRTSSRVGPM